MTAAATQRPGAARHADTKGGNKISRQSSLALKFRHLSMKILIDVSNLTANCIGEAANFHVEVTMLSTCFSPNTVENSAKCL